MGEIFAAREKSQLGDQLVADELCYRCAVNFLPAILVPTLVLHRTGDLAVYAQERRYLAHHIPGAQFVARIARKVEKM